MCSICAAVASAFITTITVDRPPSAKVAIPTKKPRDLATGPGAERVSFKLSRELGRYSGRGPATCWGALKRPSPPPAIREEQAVATRVGPHQRTKPPVLSLNPCYDGEKAVWLPCGQPVGCRFSILVMMDRLHCRDTQ